LSGQQLLVSISKQVFLTAELLLAKQSVACQQSTNVAQWQCLSKYYALMQRQNKAECPLTQL